MKPLLRWIALAGLAAAASVGAGSWLGKGQPLTLARSRPKSLDRAVPDDGRAELEASGNVEGTLVRIGSKLPGRIARVRVREGDRVTQGQELIALDARDVGPQVEQARARLATAMARYDEAQAGTRLQAIREAKAELTRAIAAKDGAASAAHNLATQFQRSTELKQGLDAAQSQLNVARATLQAAVARCDRLKAGARPDDVREAEQAVAAAQATAQRAAEEEHRMHRAYEGGAVARRAWDMAQTERDVAAASLERARAHLNDLRAGARPEELREAEQQLLAARAAEQGASAALANARRLYIDRLPERQRLDAARADLRSAAASVAAARAHLDLLRRGTRPEVVRQLRSQVGEARAALELAETRQRDLRILSPVSGVVTQRSAEPGEVIRAGARLLEVADLRKVWVRVYVPERESGRVRVGDRVTVTTDSLSDQGFSGRVAAIGQEAEYTPRNVLTKEERVNLTVAVKIEIDNNGGALRIGMPADARFL